jgi:hypothetical protein
MYLNASIIKNIRDDLYKKDSISFFGSNSFMYNPKVSHVYITLF